MWQTRFDQPIIIGALAGANDNGSIVLASNLDIDHNGSALLTLRRPIDGSPGITKSGSGTLLLSAANTYSGTTNVSGGVLKLNNASALGGGNLTLGGGVIGLTTASGDLSRPFGTGAGQIRFTGSGGFAAFGSNRTVTPGSGTWNTAPFLMASQSLILSDATSDATITYASSISLGNSGRTFQVEDGSAAIDAIMSSIISGNATSNFNKAGTGTFALTAGNTWVGACNINAGTLMIGDGTGNTGRISTTATSVAISSGAVLAINRTDVIAQGGSSPLGIGLAITGAGSVVVMGAAGTGGVIMNQANTFTGGVTLQAGVFKFGSNGVAATSGPLGNGGTFTINGGTIDTNGGVLAISHNNALGDTAGGTNMTVTGTTGASSGQLRLSGSITVAENITISGTTETGSFIAAIRNDGGSNILSGNITLSDATGSIRIGTNNSVGNSGVLTFNGTISQASTSHTLKFQTQADGQIVVNTAIGNNGGALGIIGQSASTGSVTLNAQSGTGIGETQVNARGSLKLGIADALNTTALLLIGQDSGNSANGGTADTGTLDLGGFSLMVGALDGYQSATSGSGNGSRLITNSAASGTAVLTVGNGGGSGTFNGVISDGAIAAIAFTKTGNGTQTLADSNTYTGTTSISGGTLVITGATQATTAITFSGGGVLGLTTGTTVTAASAGINFSGQQVLVTGTTGNPSYTLLAASSISGVPTLAPGSVSGYALQVVANELRLVSTGGGAYTTWTNSFPTLTNTAFDFDFDNDGIATGLEWVLGGNPTVNDAASIMPIMAGSAASGVTLTFNREEDTIGVVTLVVEYGTTLASFPNSVAIGATSSGPDGNGVTVNVNDVPAPDSVIVNVPASNAVGGKLFARLKVTMP